MKNAVKPDEQIDDVDVDDEQATPEQLAEITNLSRRQVKLKRIIGRIEERAEKFQKLLNSNMTDELPKAMQVAHIDKGKFALGGGAFVDFDEKIRANIPSPDNKKNPTAFEDNERGIAYMDNVAPDLVDNVITIKFQKGDEKFFNKFMRDLKKRKKPVDFNMKRTVHPSTLSAWVERRFAAAEEVDDKAIKVERKWVADVKLSKKAPKGGVKIDG